MHVSGVTPFTMLDFPDRIACIVFLPGCNMRCRFCHNAEFVLPEKIKKIASSFIDDKTVLRFLRKRRNKLEGVVVSGGEPTVHPEVLEFMKNVKEMGFLVKLDTNGHNPGMLKRIIDAGLTDYFAMDVKTSLAEYQNLVGPRVNPSLIKKSMQLIRGSGIEYEFRTTLIKEHHSAKVLNDMKELFHENDSFFLQQFRSGNTLDPTFGKYGGLGITEMNTIKRSYFNNLKKVNIRS